MARLYLEELEAVARRQTGLDDIEVVQRPAPPVLADLEYYGQMGTSREDGHYIITVIEHRGPWEQLEIALHECGHIRYAQAGGENGLPPKKVKHRPHLIENLAELRPEATLTWRVETADTLLLQTYVKCEARAEAFALVAMQLGRRMGGGKIGSTLRWLADNRVPLDLADAVTLDEPEYPTD